MEVAVVLAAQVVGLPLIQLVVLVVLVVLEQRVEAAEVAVAAELRAPDAEEQLIQLVAQLEPGEVEEEAVVEEVRVEGTRTRGPVPAAKVLVARPA